MHFRDYQKRTKRTAVYPKIGKNFVFPLLGLLGETGEVVEKIKKIFRDHRGKIDANKKDEIKKELGDVLWYLSQLATELGISLEDIAKTNLEKIGRRKKKNLIHGSGDDR